MVMLKYFKRQSWRLKQSSDQKTFRSIYSLPVYCYIVVDGELGFSSVIEANHLATGNKRSEFIHILGVLEFVPSHAIKFSTYLAYFLLRVRFA